MKSEKKYLEELKDSLKSVEKSVNAKDFSSADKFVDKLVEAYDGIKSIHDYKNRMLNASFLELNSILEEEMPSLIANNKSAVKECIDTIKGDKNLRAQFSFINALRIYDSDSDATSYINESVDMVKKNIDRMSLKESSKKLARVMMKYGIGMERCDIDEDTSKFNENCSFLLTNDKKVSNLLEFKNRIDEVNKHVMENSSRNKKSFDVLSMAESVEKRLNMLNENEKELVNDIMRAKTPVAENRRMKVFENMKNKCISYIDKMLGESTVDEKERLLELKNTILSKEYNKDTIVEDVAKLLEIASVLSDSNVLTI